MKSQPEDCWCIGFRKRENMREILYTESSQSLMTIVLQPRLVSSVAKGASGILVWSAGNGFECVWYDGL